MRVICSVNIYTIIIEGVGKNINGCCETEISVRMDPEFKVGNIGSFQVFIPVVWIPYYVGSLK